MRQITSHAASSTFLAIVIGCCWTAYWPRQGAAAVPNPPTAPFDDKTNGFEDQAQFDKDLETFNDVEKIEDGLGPVYNATSCASCHQNPVSGSASQIVEIRAGHLGVDPARPGRLAFIDHPGGSLVHQRAINPEIQQHVLAEDTTRTFRLSTNILGGGFVECIDDIELITQVNNQISSTFGDLRGTIILAPVAINLTSSREHVGRFGWKDQHASLLNFAADAYINEMGITSPLQPDENSSDGGPVQNFDPVPGEPTDTEDKDNGGHAFGDDVEAFTRFMRATKVPPRDDTAAQQQPAIEGEKLFRDNVAIGCAICHRPDFKTMAEGSAIDGNFANNAVPPALAAKDIHPFSDFLMHDIGTGDGIVQRQHAQFPPTSSQNVQRSPKIENLMQQMRTSQPATAPAAPERNAAPQKPRAGQMIRLFSATAGAAAGEPGGQGERNTRAALMINPQQILTGDIVDTANMIRTAPLWGLRTRIHLMHDGLSLTVDDAIRRHSGQAEKVKLNYVHVLTQQQREQLLAFLNSL